VGVRVNLSLRLRLGLASESPLLVQPRRIALGDSDRTTPVVLANLGSDRYRPESLASAERPVLVARAAGDYSPEMRAGVIMCLRLHFSEIFSYPDSIRTTHTHTHRDKAFKRSGKHNHISRYTSTGRRLPARPPLAGGVPRHIARKLIQVLRTRDNALPG
jgi:hypothetical protein